MELGLRFARRRIWQWRWQPWPPPTCCGAPAAAFSPLRCPSPAPPPRPRRHLPVEPILVKFGPEMSTLRARYWIRPWPDLPAQFGFAIRDCKGLHSRIPPLYGTRCLPAGLRRRFHCKRRRWQKSR
jgi:hypothetical protein